MAQNPKCVRCKGALPPPLKDSGGVMERWLHFPFCSERCQMIDLGVWFDEGYRIPGEKLDEALPESGDVDSGAEID